MSFYEWFFIGFGALVLSWPLSRIIHALRCTEVVDGHFLEVVTMYGSGSSSIKKAKFFYEYDGKEYVGLTDIGISMKQMRDFAKGVSYKIFVNPQNPQKFVFDRKPTLISEILPIFLALLIASLPFIKDWIIHIIAEIFDVIYDIM